MMFRQGESLAKRMQVDPSLKATIQARAKILEAIRSFFDRRGFTEVVTSSLVTAADPAVHLESFATELRLPSGEPLRLFLHTSPEYQMKRMVAAGMERIYQICSFFRNGELSPLHNPEFLGLEWYQVGTGIEQAMNQTEQLVVEVAERVLGRMWVERGGAKLDLKPPYRRFAVREVLLDLAGVEVPEDWEEGATRAALKRVGIRTAVDDRLDDLVNRALLERVEPTLSKLGPAFLYDYPAQMAALARLRPHHPWTAERFELFIGSLELCNGYGELTDAAKQRRRFLEQQQQRREMGKVVPELDEAFLQALEGGLPECSGCALGVDRLVMLLCGKERIEEVMAFPLSLEIDRPNQ